MPHRSNSPAPFGGALAGSHYRVTNRLIGEFVVRCMGRMKERFGGELISALIIVEIVTANTVHWAKPGTIAFRGVDDVPPDDERRPVSIRAVAGSLGLPFETTRRYVRKLEAAGLCRRLSKGWIVPASVIENDDQQALLGAMNRDFRRMLETLRSDGAF